MKKLSKSRKEWLLSHALRLERRRKKTSSNTRRKYSPEIIDAPSNMCLADNYEEVASFLSKMRDLVRKDRQRNKNRLAIDFTSIANLSPGAALILASELDRWRTLHCTRLRPWKLELWTDQVRRLFLEMGLFQLLGINQRHAKTTSSGTLKFFRFLTGHESDGELANRLMDNMSSVVGKLSNETAMYVALSEAMTNVVQHAYPEDYQYKYNIIQNRWWVSGSYDSSTNEMTVLFYDQGVGIPETLPRSGAMERCRPYLAKLNLSQEEDAHLIKAAIDTSRTRTCNEHRGKGIKQFLDFSKGENGQLRIISGKGEYISCQNDDKIIPHSQTIGGTFIQWNIKLPSEH